MFLLPSDASFTYRQSLFAILPFYSHTGLEFSSFLSVSDASFTFRQSSFAIPSYFPWSLVYLSTIVICPICTFLYVICHLHHIVHNRSIIYIQPFISGLPCVYPPMCNLPSASYQSQSTIHVGQYIALQSSGQQDNFSRSAFFLVVSYFLSHCVWARDISAVECQKSAEQ